MNAESVQRKWLERSGEYSPRYYAYYGPDETSERLLEILDCTVTRDARILELGCSSGRHLAYLADHGYTDLSGIDINEDAFEVMAETYPKLASQGTFFCDAIETILPEFDEKMFDVVYTVETLQHIHADNAWVFEEIARITGDVLITAEIEEPTDDDVAPNQDVNYVAEDVPLYYRDWEDVFTEYGFTQQTCQDLGHDTVRLFKRSGP